MRDLSLKVVFLFVGLLAGCATLPDYPPEPVSYADAVALGDWRHAQAILDNLESQQALAAPTVVRQQLLASIRTRETELLQLATELVNQQKWPEALTLLSRGQQLLPDSPLLQNRIEAIRADYEHHIQTLKQRLLIVEAKALAEELPLLLALEQAGEEPLLGDWKLRWRREQGYSLSEQLLECAEQMLQENQITQARDCLDPVSQLASEAQLQRLISAKKLLSSIEPPAVPTPPKKRAAARTLDNTSRARAETAHAIQRQRLCSKLKQDFEDSMQAGWLRTAGTSLQQLQRNFPADPDLAGLQASWQVAVDSYVAEKLRQGQALYGRGEIAEALKSWRKAARLAPDTPELQVNIDRAERFLNKIEVLEKQ